MAVVEDFDDDWRCNSFENIEDLYKIKFNTLMMLAHRGFDPNNFDDDDKEIVDNYPSTDIIKNRDDFIKKIFSYKIYMNAGVYDPYICEKSEALFKPEENPDIPVIPVIPVIPKKDIPIEKRKVILESMKSPNVSANIVVFYNNAGSNKLSGILAETFDLWKDIDGIKVLTIISNCAKTGDKLDKDKYPEWKEQFFTFEQMIRNHIFYKQFKHFLTSDDSRLNELEKEELRKELLADGWAFEHLPKQFVDDPASKYSCYYQGDILKIIRHSTNNDGTIEDSMIYREVIDGEQEDKTIKNK